MSAQLDAILEAIGAAPALPGALCRNRSSLFDPAANGENPDTVAARHAQALGLCGHCPALARCEEWLYNLPPRRRPPGVIAGTVRQPQ
jgi:hypothetical protein